MKGFSDQDLERFKKYLKSLGSCDHSTQLNCIKEDGLNLIRRLEATEAYIMAINRYENFDCFHYEPPCKCGEIQRKLLNDTVEAEKAWLKSKGL